MAEDLRVCLRCGQCCLNSSPSLQIKDLFLVRDGRLKWSSLYTLRKGELVWDNVAGVYRKINKELIKIREAENGGCIFYNHGTKSCSIYDCRPSQCVALFCKDTSEFERIYNSPKLRRKDIIIDRVVLGLIEKHEQKCAYSDMESLVKRIPSEGERAINGIMEILRFDTELRPFICKKLGVDPSHLDLIFGRPMIETISVFGLKVEREPDGSFLLTTLDKGK